MFLLMGVVDLYLRYMPQFLPGIAPDIPEQSSGEALPVFGYAENDSVIVVRDPDSPALAVIQRELFKIIGIDADESYFLRNVFRLKTAWLSCCPEADVGRHDVSTSWARGIIEKKHAARAIPFAAYIAVNIILPWLLPLTCPARWGD